MGLWRRTAEQRVAEFETLCLEIEAPLYSYALQLVRNATEAEDIAQESLMRLFNALQTRKQLQSPRAYAFSTAHNLCIDRHRHQRVAERAEQENIVPLRPQRPNSPAQHAERSLLREQIDRALADLPQDQRAALLLREFGEMNYQEIADTLGANVAQVKVWLFRARKRLAVLLDRDGQYIGKSHHGN